MTDPAGAGLQATAPQALTRNGPASETAAPVSPELLKAIFQAGYPAQDKPAAGTVTLASGDPAVFVVTSARPGTLDAAAAATEMPMRAQQTAQINAAVEFTAYLEELKRTSKIKKNERLFAVEQ